MRKCIILLWLFLPSLAFARVDSSPVDEQKLYFREAFYYASQGRYVEAIAKQDLALGRSHGLGKAVSDPLHFQIGNSRFSIGDYELSYRMPKRAGRAVRAILESNADKSIRNEAAYQLARIYMKMGEPENALKSIGKITGQIPEYIRDDELFLRAQILMDNGDYAGAVRLLQKLQNAKSYRGFSAYNLGVALIRIGQERQGVEQLDMAGKISGDDEATLAIRDKANLALGFRLIGSRQPDLAKKYFERVRLTGPFSNKALLGSGWADVASGRFDSALVPWSVLSKRNMNDKSVQEGMLGVPFAYAQLNLHGKATVLYGKALDGFDKEMSRLDASVKSVREGKLFQVLSHIELRQDENLAAEIKALPETPETYYLLELMASDDFQTALANYLDLAELSKKLKLLDDKLNTIDGIRQSSRKPPQVYDEQIQGIKKRALDFKNRLDGLTAKHRNILETMAIGELEQRRSEILNYQAHASIALAESYEHASKKQLQSSGEK